MIFIWLLALYIFLPFHIARGQENSPVSEVISLEEIQMLVKDHNPDLQTYLLHQEKMEIEVKRAKSYRFPSVSGSFNGQKNLELATTPLPGEIFGQPGNTIEAQFGQEYTYNAGISLYKNIFDWESHLKAKMAKLQVEQAGIQTRAFTELLDQQTALHYYSALVAKRALTLGQEDLRLADSSQALVKQLYDQGLINALSYNQARLNALNARQNLNQNRQFYAQSKNELKKLLGYPPEDSLVLKEELPRDLPELYGLTKLSPNQEIRLAEMEKQQAESQVMLQKSRYLPKLSLNAYHGWQQFRDNFGMEFGNGAWNPYSYLGVALTVPIFSGFSTKNAVKAGKVELQRTQVWLQQAQKNAALADEQLIRDYRISLQNARLAEQSVELYQENSELTYQQYQEGLVSLDRYLNAFENYLQAENSFLNTLLNTYQYYSQIISRVE